MSTTIKAKFERGVKCILVSQIWIPKAQPHSPLMRVLLWSIWTKSLLDRSHLSSSTTTRLLPQSSHGPFLCRIQSKLLGVWKQMNSPHAIPCLLLWGSGHTGTLPGPGSPLPLMTLAFLHHLGKKNLMSLLIESASWVPRCIPFDFPELSCPSVPTRDWL